MIRTTLFALAVPGMIVAGAYAADEPYPSRPFSPGGLADLRMRPVIGATERILKQPVLLVNNAQPVLAGAELGDALRRGGFVIFFRHGVAETGDPTPAFAELPAALRDCQGVQRPLTERGVSEMRAVGTAFRTLRLPVGPVLSSPACRALETAWYAFGRIERVEPDLMQIRGAPATVRRLLATAPPPGANTVIVGHVSNTLAAVNLTPEEGEALVFAPGADGSARLVGRVPVEGWAALAPVGR